MGRTIKEFRFRFTEDQVNSVMRAIESTFRMYTGLGANPSRLLRLDVILRQAELILADLRSSRVCQSAPGFSTHLRFSNDQSILYYAQPSHPFKVPFIDAFVGLPRFTIWTRFWENAALTQNGDRRFSA